VSDSRTSDARGDDGRLSAGSWRDGVGPEAVCRQNRDEGEQDADARGLRGKGATPNQFTLSDESGKYVVTGARIGRYVGLRVEIAGVSDTAKFKVKGGLWPTPNVAGQAGAIDPARAAMAAQPGGPASATGEVDLPRVVVKSVRALDSKCG
jgi:hypothetical protein